MRASLAHDSVATIEQINASKVPAFRVHIDISVTDGSGHLILFHRQLDGLEDRPFEFRLPSSNEWLKISVRSRVVKFDPSHLTPDFAKTLAPEIATALKSFGFIPQ